LITKRLDTIYTDHPEFSHLVDHLDRHSLVKVNITGLRGSSRSICCSAYLNSSDSSLLIILSDKEEAAYFHNDLVALNPDQPIYFFPSSYKRSIQYGHTDPSNLVLRTEILTILSQGEKNPVIVTYPEALIEKVVDKALFGRSSITVRDGESYMLEEIEKQMIKAGFERSDFVTEPGEYSIRGGILDVFSYASDHPFRIDFFGNDVESIRSFQVDNQLSIQPLQEVSIVPNTHNLITKESRVSFLDFLPDRIIIWADNLTFIKDRVNEMFEQTTIEQNQGVPQKEDFLITGNQLLNSIRSQSVIGFEPYDDFQPDLTVEFKTSAQPVFNKNFEILCKNLLENSEMGYTNLILSDNERQFERLKSIFQDIDPTVQFSPVNLVLHQGFIEHDLRICCYTDHQIFERYHKFRLRGNFSKREAITIKELNSLSPGDYVVHSDHGIGQFGGLEKIDINGKLQEAVKLVYKDQDVLFVRLHALHRISKYKGKEATPPRIHKLGSGAWNKLKLSTKRRIKDIARELIMLYAKRKTGKGFAFSPDSYLQNELEASFIYEDTPDQWAATIAVKEGMESSFSMDRLVCGDVGFGKTEIAIRAAFKAVTDSKQVIVLVPTTILALQHYNTFRERLRDFPCTIDYISRFKKPSVQKITLKNLAEGKVDIIIGTHRLLGNDLIFKDLGLLIVDEEQKFGVASKEKLRKIKLNVDTLTLTATPIPRTLQFSLIGVRDLSIINTPPPNRHPIITELHTFNEDLIKEAIDYEVSRGGQVFFIHNRVENIGEMGALINRISPSVRTAVAHGQLVGNTLENIMLDFIDGDYDVLIATTIIEAGLDIPNTNTIIINNAHHFGLSDLHQLRGRVGRSNKKAFCYLLAPPLSMLTPDARRRLRAIEEFSDLGSGFNIAMQDLDIRGAGNLLGGEQSGFITTIGFETYHRILDEAIGELKEEEFREYFQKPAREQRAGKEVKKELGKVLFVQDCLIDTDLELMFPDDYISNVSERLRLYRDLDNLRNENDLLKYENQLVDRFGPVPESGKELLSIVPLRWTAIQSGFEKIIIRDNTMILHFVSDQSSPYFSSPFFSKIIQYIGRNPDQFRVKEVNGKLTLRVEGVSGIQDARKVLLNIRSFVNQEDTLSR